MVVDENTKSIAKAIESQKEVISLLEKLCSDLQSSAERTNLVAEIDKAILSSTFSSDEVFRLIVKECLSKTGCKHGQVVLYRRNKLRVVASSDASKIGVELPLTGSICGQAILKRETQRRNNVKELPQGSYFPFHDETRSELAVLIKLEHSGRTLGVLSLEREQEGEFEASAVTFSKILAGQAAIAIDHSETWSSIRMLSETSTSLLSGTLTLAESLDKILASILESLDSDYGQIVQVLGDEFVILASSRPEDTGLRFGRDSVCGQHILENDSHEILNIHDIQNSEYSGRYLGLRQSYERQMQSELVVPLVDNSNRVVGALNIESTRISAFSPKDEHLLGVIGRLIANAFSAALLRRKISDEARMDAARVSLTQLGSVAQTFLHTFSSSIGDAQSRLKELKNRLPDEPIPSLRGGMPPGEFIQTILDTLKVGADAIVTFSNRFNPGNQEFQGKAVNLESVARQAMEKVKERHSQSRIDFLFESEIPSSDTRDGKQVHGKPECWLSDQINEVIENLLTNAVEAINSHGEDTKEGRILISVDMPNPFSARLQVKDSGIGISEKDQERIFDFAFTTKNRSGLGGFGLWFCKWYIMMRGGTIACLPQLGQGTTFEIVLPTLIADGKTTNSGDIGGMK